MKKVSEIFKCFFEKIGASISKKIHGNFKITNNIIPILKLNIGNGVIEDLNSNKVYSTGGIINNNGISIANINIYFFKNIISEFSDFSQTEHMKTIYTYPIYDYCKTDLNGEYNVFLEPGIYTIKIENGVYSEFLYNQEILSGLNNQYHLIPQNFTIKSRYDDIIELNNSNYKLIYGTLYDQYSKPIENAEIIISKNNEVITYLKTQKDGKYKFLLLNGIYDVRIRSIKHSIKIINSFNFESGKGFMTELQKKYNWFRKNDWIVIK